MSSLKITKLEIPEDAKNDVEDDFSGRTLLESVLDSIPYAIILKNSKCEMIESNKFFPESQKNIGKTILEIGLPATSAQWIYDKELKFLEGKEEVQDYEQTIKHPSGPRSFHVHRKLMKDAEGNVVGFGEILRDITENKRIEAETREAKDITEKAIAELSVIHEQLRMNQHSLVESTKMASLGVMASGLVHELNAPLALTKALAQEIGHLLKTNQMTPEAFSKHSTLMSEKIDEMARTIRGLRSFARESKSDAFVMTTASSLIEGTLSFCAARFKNSGIEVMVNAPANLPFFLARSVQLSQVLLNLLNNSYDAIEKLPEKWIRIGSEAFEDRIEISVEDSGPGIPQEIARRVMEPFFTTKEATKASGLGLSISQGILKEHQGALRLDSNHPHTRFVLSIPLIKK